MSKEGVGGLHEAAKDKYDIVGWRKLGKRRIILCWGNGLRSSRRSCMRDGTRDVDDWFGEGLMAGKIFREISLLGGGAAPNNLENSPCGDRRQDGTATVDTLFNPVFLICFLGLVVKIKGAPELLQCLRVGLQRSAVTDNREIRCNETSLTPAASRSDLWAWRQLASEFMYLEFGGYT